MQRTSRATTSGSAASERAGVGLEADRHRRKRVALRRPARPRPAPGARGPTIARRSRSGQPRRHRLRRRAEPPGREAGREELDRVGQRDRHERPGVDAALGVGARQLVGAAVECGVRDCVVLVADGDAVGLALGVPGEGPAVGHQRHRRPNVFESCRRRQRGTQGAHDRSGARVPRGLPRTARPAARGRRHAFHAPARRDRGSHRGRGVPLRAAPVGGRHRAPSRRGSGAAALHADRVAAAQTARRQPRRDLPLDADRRCALVPDPRESRGRGVHVVHRARPRSRRRLDGARDRRRERRRPGDREGRLLRDPGLARSAAMATGCASSPTPPRSSRATTSSTRRACRTIPTS